MDWQYREYYTKNLAQSDGLKRALKREFSELRDKTGVLNDS